MKVLDVLFRNIAIVTHFVNKSGNEFRCANHRLVSESDVNAVVVDTLCVVAVAFRKAACQG